MWEKYAEIRRKMHGNQNEIAKFDREIAEYVKVELKSLDLMENLKSEENLSKSKEIFQICKMFRRIRDDKSLK